MCSAILPKAAVRRGGRCVSGLARGASMSGGRHVARGLAGGIARAVANFDSRAKFVDGGERCDYTPLLSNVRTALPPTFDLPSSALGSPPIIVIIFARPLPLRDDLRRVRRDWRGGCAHGRRRACGPRKGFSSHPSPTTTSDHHHHRRRCSCAGCFGSCYSCCCCCPSPSSARCPDLLLCV